MKYKVLAYDFRNTGGNCMVSITDVWLPDENKTVYVFTNDEGCSISAVDYIRNDITVDDYDDVTIDSFEYLALSTDEMKANKYFELYRWCLNAFVRDYCSYFNSKRVLPFILLSDNLRRQITAEYRKWHEENISERFMTDGCKIIIEENYKPIRMEKEKLTFALWQFKHAHQQLVEEWQRAYYIDLGSLKANEKYPFTASFDEIDVAGWVEAIVDELFDEE